MNLKLLLGLSLVLSGVFTGYATEIRVRNDSTIDFKDVVVGGKNYGDIKRGATTDYQTWEKAYRYSSVSLLADSKPLKVQPEDYVGESPLGDGHFTYVLTIQDGRLDIRAETTSESPAPPSPRFPKTVKSEWTLQTNAIMGISIPPPELELKKAVYNAQYLPTNSLDITVVALRNPHSGNIYVGPEMSFYIETDSQIVGGCIRPGIVIWCDGLVFKQKDLPSAISVFDKEVDGSTLARSCPGHDSDLRKVLRRRFFTRRGDTDSESIQATIKSVVTKNGKVQIDLENPVTHSTASVWIDTKTWKPTKAIEDGKQVFPKPWW